MTNTDHFVALFLHYEHRYTARAARSSAINDLKNSVVSVPESEILGASRHKSLQTTTTYMRQDQAAEAKRVYAKLNASRPPQLKVNATDPLEKQIVPGFTPRALPVLNTTIRNVASLPSLPFFKNLQKPNSRVHGTNPVGGFVGGTYGGMFPGFCNNFFMPMQQYPVPIIHYHGNVTINNNYTYPTNNSVSTMTDDRKRPYNPYLTTTSPT